ncbi:GNAT family N-acetyltransferase [Lysinibacillus sp. 2017]|uniref:GNAT family N-acetyltransferase n=1 Tax=unclassified Lysinibacillus TaxID=2636778 RepID=UPI000D52A194|nr:MULTISPECIES: GNAT family N-acetyltransferase [unclassified Lysinibacillus]AWE07640.1 GNAT family N-acetyltransferase [Lysinibacillus sp. 2017]TGN36803.1 GNAT family N-acetyltransferase [Lysinibacillus sp. S2017]
MKIQKYTSKYEESWLRCRVLAYLHTSLYEDVETSKPTFEGRPSIELIVVEDGMVVGLLDMVLDTEKLKTSFLAKGLGAFLKVIAVHPDYQSRGIGRKLFETALKELENTPIEFIELYTRDDEQANNFYKKLGFDLLLETYDVFGVEKSLSKDIFITGIEDKKLKAKTENGEPCDFVLVGGVYEVYDLKALEKIEYDRYYPSRGYYKKIK